LAAGQKFWRATFFYFEIAINLAAAEAMFVTGLSAAWPEN
jgi:hypothetical protein